MEQIALRLDRPDPAELLAQLDLTASSSGITRVSCGYRPCRVCQPVRA